MVAGVVLTGIVFGVLTFVASLTAGLPFWLCVLLYPVAGALGGMGLIAWANLRADALAGYAPRGLATTQR